MTASALEDAARAVDAFLSANGPPFRFDRKHVGEAAQIALLILHDELNTLDAIAAGIVDATYAEARAELAEQSRGGSPVRLRLLEVEADGLEGTKHYAEPGALATLCGLTDLYPALNGATLCAACAELAARRAGGHG